MKKLRRLLDRFGLDKGLAYVTLGNILYSVLTALLWLYLASIFTPLQYGKINYDISVVSILTAVGTLGFDTTLTAFLAKGNLRMELETNVLVGLAAAVLSLILILLFNSLTLGFLLVSMLLFAWVTADALGRQLFKHYMSLISLQRGISLLIVPILFYLNGLDGALFGFAISYLILTRRYFIVLIQALRKSRLSISTLAPIRNYFFHSYVLGIVKSMPYFSDKILILPFFGAAIVGYYQFGSQMASITSIIPVILYSYLLPREANGSKKSFHRTKVLGMLCSIVVTIIIFITIPYIVNYFFPRYSEAIVPAQIIILGGIPLSQVAIFNSSYMAMGRSYPVIIGALIYISLQSSLIIILGNIIGIIGLSLAAVIAASCQCYFLFYYRKYE